MPTYSCGDLIHVILVVLFFKKEQSDQLNNIKILRLFSGNTCRDTVCRNKVRTWFECYFFICFGKIKLETELESRKYLISSFCTVIPVKEI